MRLVRIELVFKDTCQQRDEMRTVGCAIGVTKGESHTPVISLIATEILLLSIFVCLLPEENSCWECQCLGIYVAVNSSFWFGISLNDPMTISHICFPKLWAERFLKKGLKRVDH